MYPRDAITIYFATKTAGTYTILPASTTSYTLLNQYITDSSGLDNSINVGTNVFLKNNAGAIESNQHLVFNNKVVQAKKSGTATTTFIITYVPRDRNKIADPTTDLATTTPITVASSSLSGLEMKCIFGCNGTTTVNFPSSLAVNNFPTGFNVNNFPALQPVAVNNFPSLQDVRCTIGCDSSSTLILSSSSIEILTTTAPTFQEWMLVCGVFLAINSIHLWNFLFKSVKPIK